MSVDPGFIHVSFSKSTAVQDVAVALSNTYDTPQQFSASIVDVDSLSPSLTPLNTSNSEAAKSVTIINPDNIVSAHDSINILLHINSAGLSSGGHYAALMIKNTARSKNKTIPIQQAVAVTLFITKEDGAIRSLALESSLPSGILFSRPNLQHIVLRNSGNTEVTPRVSALVLHKGEVVAKAVLASTQEIVLPNVVINKKLEPVFYSHFGFGKYNYQINYRYDGQDIAQNASSTFWYVPAWFAVIVGIGLVALLQFATTKRRQIVQTFVSLHVHKKILSIFNKKSKKNKQILAKKLENPKKR